MVAATGADLASLLRRFRTQAGISQQVLADRALISAQAVSALERGSRKVPYRYTLERIADALELDEEARAELELSAKRARGLRLEETAAAPAHNLPRQLTSFFGRTEAVKEVVELLAETPLVTIVGTGGAGKTRLAIAVGFELLKSFADGVWFVELAPLTDPALVPQALAAALRVQESPNRPLLETLVAYLARKRALIVFDNCEHVISLVRSTVGSLLHKCPSLALLATSREPLGGPGERAYRIPPLAVPSREVASPEEAAGYGAVELFVDRMRAVYAQAGITSENVAPIVEICRRLEGLPLALELAAARTAVLSPRDVCERLDRALDVLNRRDPTAIPRHETMRAVIDWSYGLLSSQARLLVNRLAIFAGSFSLDAASTVCCDEQLAAVDFLELFSLLVAQSLVAVDFARDATRYHLLDVTRQYALEKLEESGERGAVAARHALAFLSLAERFDRDWYDAPEQKWFGEAEIEIDNFRTALVWALAGGHDLRSGRSLAAALARVWYSIAPVEGRRWVRLAIEVSDDETPADVLARLHIADAELSGSLGEYKASLAAARQALRLDGALDELQHARAKQAAGSALGGLGRGDEGQPLLEDALAIAQRLGNRRMQALVLGDLGTTRTRCGDIEGARKFYADALVQYEALNLERPAASIAGNLAEVEFAAGDAAAALHLAEEARAGHEATQNRRSVANDLCNMAAYLIALDCFDDARAYAREALSAVRDVKRTVLSAYVLQHLVAAAVLQSDAGHHSGADAVRKRAAMLLGFVDAWLTKLEACREYTERQEYERIIATLREAMGDRLEKSMLLGAEWTEDVAVSVASEL
ncbi:MAG: helix-turn-helix domain-containing protein [Candidatus Eremiobacteraeota bacterium]|nr:helix-turn-helix domain-containing protein [Candidatus Eremiobacteraeota bacterium]